MKRIELLDSDIEILRLDTSLKNKLKIININKVKDLWMLNSTYLKNNKFIYSDISLIRVKLQLIGLDLNKKVY